MAKLILIMGDNGTPELHVRNVLTGEIEDGKVVAYHVEPPVIMKEGPTGTIPIDQCFEYDKTLFEQVNTHVLAARQSIETAAYLAQQLEPVEPDPVTPDQIEWFDTQIRWH
jgi:hypothetical protein